MALKDARGESAAVEDAPSLVLSTVEAVYLAGLLGARMLLGVADPFDGWLAENVRGAMDRARAGLAERGLIEIDANGVTVDTTVAALLGTWAHAEASLLARVTRTPGGTDVHSFHLTRHLVVEEVQEPESIHHLSALPTSSAVCGHVLHRLGLGSQRAAPGSRVVLTEMLLAEARGRAAEEGPGAASRVLERARVESIAARALAESLAPPVTTGALVAMAHRLTTWEVAGVAFLEGPVGLWLLRPVRRGEESWVEALPCDPARAQDEVRRVIYRVLPEPPPELKGGGRCSG